MKSLSAEWHDFCFAGIASLHDGPNALNIDTVFKGSLHAWAGEVNSNEYFSRAYEKEKIKHFYSAFISCMTITRTAPLSPLYPLIKARIAHNFGGKKGGKLNEDRSRRCITTKIFPFKVLTC